MIKTLVAVRFRALLAGMTAQSRQKKKKTGKGMTILFAVLYLYVGLVIAGSMCLNFAQLGPDYHEAGMDWMYFVMAAIMALALSLFGGVFMTQSQLYDAKDNALLLSMPIPPSAILMSRMIPLLALNLVFCALVMVPATVMYAVLIEASFLNIILQVLTLAAVTLLSQAISCLLGWGLHWLLSRMNKSLASLVYMIGFLVIYFAGYANSGAIMNAMNTGSTAMGQAIRTRVWPLYAMGMGCTGKALYFLVFLAICAGVFGLVYWLLSATFLRAATASRSTKRRKLDMASVKAGSATQAIIHKEWKRFLGSPVYLTNCGVGVLMTGAMAVAGVAFRDTLMELAVSMDLTGYIAPAICGMMGIMNAMSFISAPSVSLEGKNLWVLKSMPVPGKVILRAKLWFHCLLTTPVTVLGGLVLAIVYGCGLGEILLCMIVPGLLTLLCGLIGMVFGLLWARLDWISEAYPVKQGFAAGGSMLVSMAVPMALAGCFLVTGLKPMVFLVLCVALLSAACFGLYRLMVTWGVTKWNSL